MTLSSEQIERLTRLRQRTYDVIEKYLAEDGHCKSYEGTWELTACWPNYFDAKHVAAPEPTGWVLTLHCYLFGPSRHYSWHAETVDAVLAQGEAAVDAEEAGKHEDEFWGDYPNYWCGKCDRNVS
jgi:hypothetical protein